MQRFQDLDILPAADLLSGVRTPFSVWVGFVAMCAGMFMAILDVQVVATSLPTIQSALEIDPDRMSWIQTAYLIAEVVAIPLTGTQRKRARSWTWQAPCPHFASGAPTGFSPMVQGQAPFPGK